MHEKEKHCLRMEEMDGGIYKTWHVLKVMLLLHKDQLSQQHDYDTWNLTGIES